MLNVNNNEKTHWNVHNATQNTIGERDKGKGEKAIKQASAINEYSYYIVDVITI